MTIKKLLLTRLYARRDMYANSIAALEALKVPTGQLTNRLELFTESLQKTNCTIKFLEDNQSYNIDDFDMAEVVRDVLYLEQEEESH